MKPVETPKAFGRFALPRVGGVGIFGLSKQLTNL